jgi:hypothetical protein
MICHQSGAASQRGPASQPASPVNPKTAQAIPETSQQKCFGRTFPTCFYIILHDHAQSSIILHNSAHVPQEYEQICTVLQNSAQIGISFT